MFGMMEALLSFFRRQVGLRTDTASTTGSLHAKIGTMIGKPIIVNGSAVKSVQRGTLVLSSSQTSNTATISAVNMAKTMLNFLGASAGSSAETAPTNRYAQTSHHFVRLTLTDSTTVTATRVSHHDREATVSYEVIEYW